MGKYAIQNVFGIEGWNIAWYGVIIAVGMLLGVVLASYRAKKDGFKSDMITDFILIALPVAIISARIYYVIFEWNTYKSNLGSVVKIWEGGLAIYGGVIGGVLAASIFCKYHKIPLFRFLDIAVPSLVLGQAIGRWGNFMNQEAFGNIVTTKSLQFFPYAVYIDELQEWHQATFFYESMWNVCLLVAMLYVSRKKVKVGTVTCMYLIFYGLGRCMIEGLRTDSLYLFAGIRVSQLLSIILMISGLAIWFLFVRREFFTKQYTGKYRYSK